MKCLLFTDLHLGIHNNSDIWLEKSILLAKTMSDYGTKHNIKNIICLGDFFNDRRSLNTKTIDTAHNFIEILKDFNLYVIIGNHDTYFKNTSEVHSLRMFNGYEHVTIVNDRFNIENITLVSWGSQSTHKDDNKVLMGHFEINGHKMNNSMVVEHAELNPKDFSEYDIVLSGHFHTPSKGNNINYIGSCMPFTFNDVDSSRGFYEFDSTTLDLKFIEFNDAPKYVIQYSDKEINKNKITNNIVKLVYVNDVSTENADLLLADIQSLNPLFLFTEFKNVNSDEFISQDDVSFELKDNMQIFNQYIDKLKLPEYIQIDKLKSLLNSLNES